MTLPKWVEESGFEHSFKTECIKDEICYNCKMHKALAIATEALESMRLGLFSTRNAKLVSEQALAAIEKLGEKK